MEATAAEQSVACEAAARCLNRSFATRVTQVAVLLLSRLACCGHRGPCGCGSCGGHSRGGSCCCGGHCCRHCRQQATFSSQELMSKLCGNAHIAELDRIQDRARATCMAHLGFQVLVQELCRGRELWQPGTARRRCCRPQPGRHRRPARSCHTWCCWCLPGQCRRPGRPAGRCTRLLCRPPRWCRRRRTLRGLCCHCRPEPVLVGPWVPAQCSAEEQELSGQTLELLWW